MALDGRLRRLEDRLRRQDDPMNRPVDPDWLAVLEEYGRLKGSMAETNYRGSPNGLVWIPPENIPEKVLGPTYTQRQFCELAVSRGLKKRGHSASEIAELMPGFLAFLEEGPRDEHIGAVDCCLGPAANAATVICPRGARYPAQPAPPTVPND